MNSVPHLGTAYTTIAADALARYRRMTGDDVRFLTGLDEHGQKVAQAAAEARRQPAGVGATTIAPKFLETWELLDITNDDFIRTTEDAPRARARSAFLQALHDGGHLYQGHYEGWYCVPDETFCTEEQLAEGKCPDCGRDVRVHPRGQLVLQALRVRGAAARVLRGAPRVRAARDAPQRGRVASCAAA